MPESTTKKNDNALNIWDRVEIIVGEGKDISVYISRVEDITGEKITITKPNWVRGGKGLTYSSLVYIQFKKPDAMYRFSASMRPLKSKSDELIQLYNIGKTERVQRRQFVRVHYNTRIRYWLFKKAEGQVFAEEKWRETISEDFSAGGTLLRNNADEIEQGDLIIVRVRQYDKMGIPPFVAAICRRTPKAGETTMAGMEFITMDQLIKHFTTEEIKALPPHIQKFNIQSQNNLVRFIFEEQVRERQKGLL